MATEILKDSVETLSNDITRQFSDRSRGKVRKGFVTSHGTVPTIPSKYLTVLTDNNEKKGFQKSSKRFEYCYTDTPGPGSYTTSETTSITLNSPSHSRKGYGPFASTASRSNQKLNPGYTPGAGAYDLVPKSSSFSRRDFSQGPSPAFQQPIAIKHDKENDMPAPNAYDVAKSSKWVYKQNNVSADNAFKSHSKRIGSIQVDKEIKAAPNSYNVNDDFKHEAVRVPYSSFKTNTQRHSFTPNSNGPAPNQYRPYEPITENIERQLFPRRHYLAISAPAVSMAPDLPLPGPGAYNVRDFREPEKRYMSSAAFVSSTSRWLNGASQNVQAFPGPANYFPAKLTKQSFHYNYEKKWV